MNIHNLNLLKSLYPTSAAPASHTVSKRSAEQLQENQLESFSKVLNDSLNNLSEKQLASDQAIQGLITGEADNLHQVMIQTTEAQIALELAVQLRNRSLEAMNEIKNMQF